MKRQLSLLAVLLPLWFAGSPAGSASTSLTVKTLDLSGRTALEGVVVVVVQGKQTFNPSATNADGETTVNGLTAGQAIVTATLSGYIGGIESPKLIDGANKVETGLVRRDGSLDYFAAVGQTAEGFARTLDANARAAYFVHQWKVLDDLQSDFVAVVVKQMPSAKMYLMSDSKFAAAVKQQQQQ